jgi:hypothetical protein
MFHLCDTAEPALAPFLQDQRLWCLQCQRSFLGRDARVDPRGIRQACAFADCEGAGYGVDLYDQHDPFAPGLALTPRGGETRDRARRDALLGVISTDDPDDHVQFTDVDLVRLAALVQERFVDPQASCGAAPSVMEFVAFLCHFPEARVHGHVTGGSDDAPGCFIEGVACDLDDVTPDRREALRGAFEAFCDADVFHDRDERLYAWWQ